MFPLQNHELRPITTAHLAQTMSLLGMSAIEIQQKVESDLANNPALELIRERRCPTCWLTLSGSGHCPICSRPKELFPDNPIVFVSSRDDFYPKSYDKSSAEEVPDYRYTSTEEDLATYVLKQIAVELRPQDRKIALHILTCLDEDGLLTINPIEISRYHHVPLSRVEVVIDLIQHADPLGVGSKSTKDALLVQLEVLSESMSIPPLAKIAIEEGFDQLCRHQYAELSRKIGSTVQDIKWISRFIHDNLNPFPARAYWGGTRQGTTPGPPVYYRSDIVIKTLNSQNNSPLVVEIIIPLGGTLRVNPLFREALKYAPLNKIHKWKKDLEQAHLLIKCLQQRNNTMRRLLEIVATRQRSFILHGDKYLHPTTRAQMSKELGVHESTVSRAVAGKAVQLPNGRIVSLRRFFDPSLHIRATVQEIIKFENKPLTDIQVSEILTTFGYKVARRTVAKYRAMEGILPAHLRRKIKAH